MRRAVFGEMHGQMEYFYPKIRQRYKHFDELIIAGEEGFGFPGDIDRIMHDYGKSITSRPYIRFIRGNHSDVDKCREFNYEGLSFIEDGTIDDGILFVGGAESIDKALRIPGLTWWETEELSIPEFDAILNKVENNKEQIHTVISHDVPREVQHLVLPQHKEIIKTRTDAYLEEIRQILNGYVKNWYFAHYHVERWFQFEGVNYYGLLNESAHGEEVL